MERRREPANANPDTGRLGFRYEWEPRDERPCVVYPHPFWRDEDERLAYERAVMEIRPWEYYEAPRDWDPADKTQREQGGRAWMGLAQLCEEITSLAVGFQGGLKTPPKPWQTRRERDAALLRLRFQAREQAGRIG